MRSVECVVCHLPMAPTRGGGNPRKYCSSACSRFAIRERSRGPDRPCVVCSVPVPVIQGRSRRTHAYCPVHSSHYWRSRISRYGPLVGPLLLSWDGNCDLCGERVSENPGGFVDHCHATGIVRGILHSRCNSLLAWMGDSVEGLESFVQKARAYLEVSP